MSDDERIHIGKNKQNCIHFKNHKHIEYDSANCIHTKPIPYDFRYNFVTNR